MQIVMLLPTQLPVDSNNMNYTCVTVGAVMILVMGAWYLPYWGAKNWVCPYIISAAQRASHCELIYDDTTCMLPYACVTTEQNLPTCASPL